MHWGGRDLGARLVKRHLNVLVPNWLLGSAVERVCFIVLILLISLWNRLLVSRYSFWWGLRLWESNPAFLTEVAWPLANFFITKRCRAISARKSVGSAFSAGVQKLLQKFRCKYVRQQNQRASHCPTLSGNTNNSSCWREQQSIPISLDAATTTNVVVSHSKHLCIGL